MQHHPNRNPQGLKPNTRYSPPNRNPEFAPAKIPIFKTMTTIIQVRGTSGSGKSTVLKKLMSHYSNWQPITIPGRRRPQAYVLPLHSTKPTQPINLSPPHSTLPTNPSHGPTSFSEKGIVVLGHYEIACGGCDTLGSAREAYEAQAQILADHNVSLVICEGLLLSEDTKWTIQMREDGHEVRCYYLTTDLDTC